MLKYLAIILLALVCLSSRADFAAHGFFGSSSGGVRPPNVVLLGPPDGLVLPAPLIFEDFENGTEFDLSGLGWTEQNYTDVVTPGINPDNATSDSYRGWVLITRSRLSSVFDSNRLNVSPGQVVNGQPVVQLLSGKLLYAESDKRSGDQVQFLYSPIYDFAGRRHLVLSFNSAYHQNQDSIAGIEFTTDRGETWHPVVYMIDRDDIVLTGGEVDAVATLTAQHTDVAVYVDPANGSQIGQSFGAFLAAPISSALAPYISGRINDDAVESKRVETFRIPLADEQPNVQFRLFQAGTASWYWGIDDWGIYSIPPQTEVSETLLDHASGAPTGIQTLLTVNGRELTAQLSLAAGGPRAPAPGTDGALLFDVDLAQASPTPLPAHQIHRLRSTGLDASKAYDLLLYSDLARGDGSTGVELTYTILSAVSFENLSSAHATLSSVSGANNETTTLDISDNSAAGRGLVCRYNRVRTGEDGTVEILLQSTQPASLNALKLIESTLETVRLAEPPAVTETSATLYGEVASDTAVQVFLLWGTTSGGQATNAWGHVEALGTFTEGPFSAALQNLQTFQKYHYAFLTVGPEGESWSAPDTFRPQTEGMVYQTGFEPNEKDPFLPGNLQGQGRPGLWRVNQGQANVQLETVSSGLQAVQAGECTIELTLTNDSDVVWIDAFFSETGTANLPLVPTNQASSVVFFSTTQGILALDGDGQGSGTFVPVVADYAKDRFVRVTVRTDYTAQRYDVWIDGIRRREGLGFKDNTVQKLSGAQRRSQYSNYMDDFSVSLWGLDADSDGDGLVDLDEAKFYGSYPLMADSDGDGAWDGHEVLARTDPADPRSRFAVTIDLDNEGRKRIGVPTISGLDYTLQRRGKLDTGQWEDVPGATGIVGDGQPQVFLETSDGVNYFYRGVIQNR